MALSTWLSPRTWTAALVTVLDGNTYWRDAFIALKTSADAEFQARLTLETGVAVSQTDQTAKTTLYLTRYGGGRVSIYNATLSFWETTLLTADLSISLAGLTANLPYDCFVYESAGSPVLELVAWSSATARATALTTQNGVLVKTGSVGKRYVGTICINATGGQCEDTLRQRLVFNYYNRIPRPLRRLETTATWTYTTATLRQANAAAANQVEIINGWQEDTIDLLVLAGADNPGTAKVDVAIGENVTNAAATGCLRMFTELTSDVNQLMSRLVTTPRLGYSYFAWLEESEATSSTTWRGTTDGQAGICGTWRC